MSWSVGAIGKAAAVAARIEKDFKGMESYPCPEPEESAKQLVRQAIAKLLEGHSNPTSIIQVLASGSQSWNGDSKSPTNVTNFLEVSIKPISIIE
jgi:hypothetical protein